jgi:DNA-binding NarL/FixJ family response regulator
MNKKIKLLLVDDHSLMRQGVEAMLRLPEIEIVGSVGSAEEAIEEAAELKPDIVLMDIMLRKMNGIEATRWIRERDPEIKVILLSMEVKKEFLSAGIQCGISGYLHKDVDRDNLLQAIREVYSGGKYFNEAITSLVFEDFYNKAKVGTSKAPQLTALSKREEEVMSLVAQGLSNKEVGEKLFISVKTVEAHRSHILDKLGLKNTAELIKYAIRHNIAPL